VVTAEAAANATSNGSASDLGNGDRRMTGEA
jgi:hypothetical protein